MKNFAATMNKGLNQYIFHNEFKMITQRKSVGDTLNLWMSLHHGKKQHSIFQVKGLWIRKIATRVFSYILYLSFTQEGDLGNRQNLGGRQTWGIVLVFLLWLKNGKDSGDSSLPPVINVAVLCTGTGSSWPAISSSYADDNSRTRVFGCPLPPHSLCLSSIQLIWTAAFAAYFYQWHCLWNNQKLKNIRTLKACIFIPELKFSQKVWSHCKNTLKWASLRAMKRSFVIAQYCCLWERRPRDTIKSLNRLPLFIR